ncbi:MAG: hypothetical protein L3J91_03720 [Thermoplasmata archaeon]|nr:hypothetical protein [Thermoplasmata archaeon]
MAPPLASDERRWLHDKYERLANEEASLADSRTSYFAAIASALVAALVVLVINELGRPTIMVTMTTFLAAFGILISTVWTVVLHRTADAQALWRDAAILVERTTPPIATAARAQIPVHGKVAIDVDLTRPYQVHQIRFATGKDVPWIDRLNPSAVSANVPLTMVGLWCLVLVGIWYWFLFLQ